MKKSIGSTQWDAIMNYAASPSNHQYAPVALYITFTAPTTGERQKVQKEAMQKGVSAAVVSIFPRFANEVTSYLLKKPDLRPYHCQLD